MFKRILVGFAIVGLIVAGVILLRPEPQPHISGTLSSGDIAQITQIARSQMRRGIFPDFSWESAKQLPSALRRRWSDRILSIHVNADGTVEVHTGFTGGAFGGSGGVYRLRREPDGWRLMSIGSWISSVSQPNSFWISSNPANQLQFVPRIPCG